MNIDLDIGRDFSPDIGGRYKQHGPFSGEQFREEKLIPALAAADTVTIHLDAISGYSASFFEEAFGGVVRKLGPSVIPRMSFETTSRKYLVPKIQHWMNEAIKEHKLS